MTNPLEYGKCLETGETTKSLEKSLFQGILSFLLFLDTFEYRKCLETVETTKSLEIMTFSRDFVVFLFLDTFE